MSSRGCKFTPFGDPIQLLYEKHPLGLWYKTKTSTWHLYDHTQMGFLDYEVWAANRKNKIVRHYDLLDIRHVMYCGKIPTGLFQLHNGWESMLKANENYTKGICIKCLKKLKNDLKEQGLLVRSGRHWVYTPSIVEESPKTIEEIMVDKGETLWYDM